MHFYYGKGVDVRLHGNERETHEHAVRRHHEHRARLRITSWCLPSRADGLCPGDWLANLGNETLVGKVGNGLHVV
jgi:hypothetical protein